MCRWGLVIVAALFVANLTGCCASPYRRWQNYIGWNCPNPEFFYKDGPRPPVTTPPGPVTPAVITAPKPVR